MNEINVLEFLKEFNVDIPEKISRGSLFKITYTGDLRSVSFHLKFSELVDFESNEDEAVFIFTPTLFTVLLTTKSKFSESFLLETSCW